jgi:nucleoside-diphosphate-sugar epimerase
VVHLAAIPGATFAPNVATFDNNLVSIFHIFQAAKLFKINNLVWASSETLLGYPFDNPPPYVPLERPDPTDQHGQPKPANTRCPSGAKAEESACSPAPLPGSAVCPAGPSITPCHETPSKMFLACSVSISNDSA